MCAACAQGGLRTVSGKRRPATAGYCRRCGVFVHFACGKTEGKGIWKKHLCRPCGGKLRPSTLLLMVPVFMLLYGPLFLSLEIGRASCRERVYVLV